MDRLPFEIIEGILKNSVLTIKDVINFSCTCTFYRQVVVCSNALWRKKFTDKWPEFGELFELDYEHFYDEVIYVCTTFKKIQYKLETMPSRFCKKYELSESELEEWNEYVDSSNSRPKNYQYLVTYLMNIVNTVTPIDTVEVVPLSSCGNKTTQYYANKILRHVRQLYLNSEWLKYRGLLPREQLLEHGAVFVAQWCQPHLQVSYAKISSKLDDIANTVMEKLQILYPEHSIFRASEHEMRIWKFYNLEKNIWNVHECRQIMTVMKEVLFEDMKFRGNNVAYYMPQNSFINEVLEFKQGLPITLAVIYESIARRLGLRMDPINFPAHFLLRFNEDARDWYYIDVFNAGNIVRKNSCPHRRFKVANRDSDNVYHAATAVQVVERMANNLEVSARQHTQVNGRVTRLRSSLELLKLVSPQDMTALVSLARLYMLHSIDTRPLEQFLINHPFEVPEQAQRIVHMLRDYESHPSRVRPAPSSSPVEAARRPTDLKYAVGMVMTHLALDYKCVIYDWDPECLASEHWQEQMQVRNLRLGARQPFYNVLVEDGSHRYVAQENLHPTMDTGFLYLNDDVGHHFSHFCRTHYVPNADKEREYPQDRAVRLLFHEKLLSIN